MPKKPFTLQLDPRLVKRVDEAASSSGVSRQEWIAEACRMRLAGDPAPPALPTTDLSRVDQGVDPGPAPAAPLFGAERAAAFRRIQERRRQG